MPIHLAASGLGSSPTIIDLGGPPYLLPLVDRTKGAIGREIVNTLHCTPLLLFSYAIQIKYLMMNIIPIKCISCSIIPMKENKKCFLQFKQNEHFSSDFFFEFENPKRYWICSWKYKRSLQIVFEKTAK